MSIHDRRDAALARHLAYTVLRWHGALEWLAGQLLAKPLKKRDKAVQRLLLMGLQQLWHDQAADHAVINETAECARLVGRPWAVGLINAILRRFQREQEAMLETLSRTPCRFAHPDWMLKAFKNDWPEHWQELADANNRQAPLWLRINRKKANETVLIRDLKEAGFKVSSHEFARDAIAVFPAAAVEAIPHFHEGWLSVQDPAAQLARDLLSPQTGNRILDACAAPGGKAAHLLESCEGLELLALDRQASRTEQIHDNLDRLGLEADVRVADASETSQWWNEQAFDKILLDAPCSASGVIRRHPEIKWLRRPDQVDSVVETQRTLLDSLWPLLQPGGMLVYATCSVFKLENEDQIKSFLHRHPDAMIEAPEVEWGTAGPYGRQVLPGEAQMDGFFYAVIRKPA